MTRPGKGAAKRCRRGSCPCQLVLMTSCARYELKRMANAVVCQWDLYIFTDPVAVFVSGSWLVRLDVIHGMRVALQWIRSSHAGHRTYGSCNRRSQNLQPSSHAMQ